MLFIMIGRGIERNYNIQELVSNNTGKWNILEDGTRYFTQLSLSSSLPIKKKNPSASDSYNGDFSFEDVKYTYIWTP